MEVQILGNLVTETRVELRENSTRFYDFNELDISHRVSDERIFEFEKLCGYLNS